MITAHVTGVENVARILNRTLPAEMQKQLADGVKEEAQQIASVARLAAPQKTGQLRAAITVRTKNKGLTAAIGVFSASRGYIARFVEFGTKPHTIEPKNRKALVFGTTFTEKVEHPGAKPHDFLLEVTKAQRASFQARLRQAIITALEGVNRS